MASSQKNLKKKVFKLASAQQLFKLVVFVLFSFFVSNIMVKTFFPRTTVFYLIGKVERKK